jgi:hypothetical protein
MSNIEKLKDIIKNPNDKLIAVDLDGTLSIGECWNDTDEPKPIQPMIDFVNSLYKRGGHIIIYSSRFPSMYQMTFAWLIKYGVLFHGIALQKKCGADCYIDDKAINTDDVYRLK